MQAVSSLDDNCVPNSHWIYTMYRCALAAVAAAFLIAPAAAQQRAFPQNALRGAIVIDSPTEVTLNGQPARLAPGLRIRGQNNMLDMSAGLIGQKLLVNYTVDIQGLVKDVWILTADEAARKPWPTTPAEAQAWSFDPVAQAWTKP
ncbi:MAG TPA: hypothetical protein VGP22_12585 [Albitalea sp.]|nr:hypothetical protein [Albitalea sp.]